jgi:hypothetical protein
MRLYSLLGLRGDGAKQCYYSTLRIEIGTPLQLQYILDISARYKSIVDNEDFQPVMSACSVLGCDRKLLRGIDEIVNISAPVHGICSRPHIDSTKLICLVSTS